MYPKTTTFLLTISLIASIGLAAKDPAYIPLAASVGGGIAAICSLLKPDDRSSSLKSKEDNQE